MRECSFPDDCRASRACYSGRGCRGAACTEAERVYQRDRKRRERRPDVIASAAYVPAGQTRTHLEELRAAGVGSVQVARKARLHRSTIYVVRSGRRATIKPETRDRILAVTGDRLSGWERRHGTPAAPSAIGEDVLAAIVFPEPPGLWRADAECLRLGMEERARQAPFFPTRGESAQAAREVCERCPVAEPCLDFALATNAPGIWGATTGGERRLIRRLDWSAAEVFALAGSEPDRPLIALLEDELERREAAS